MNRRGLILLLGLVIAVFGLLAPNVVGQTSSGSSPLPLLEPLDRLGSVLLGGTIPPTSGDTRSGSQHAHRHGSAPRAAGRSAASPSSVAFPSRRSASHPKRETRTTRPTLWDAILGRSVARTPTVSRRAATPTPRSASSASPRPAAEKAGSRAVRVVRQPAPSSSEASSDLSDSAPLPERIASKPATGAKRLELGATVGQKASAERAPSAQGHVPSSARDLQQLPLYRRLEALTASPFEQPDAPQADGEQHSPSDSPADDRQAEHDMQAGDNRSDAPQPVHVHGLAKQQASQQGEGLSGTIDQSNRAQRDAIPQASQESSAPSPTLADSSDRSESAAGQRRSPTVPPDASAGLQAEGQSASASARGVGPAEAAQRSTGVGGKLRLAQQAPSLRVEATGPSEIAIGKQATYQVRLANLSKVPAEAVVVRIQVPAWALIEDTQADEGTARIVPATAPGTQQLVWEVSRLEAEQQTALSIHLILKESRPLELVVDWDYKRAPFQALIRVKQPKLELTLRGPEQVHCGQTAAYVLQVRNVGTGAAEQITIAVAGDAAGEITPAERQIDRLAPSESKQIELKLVARQPGAVNLQVHAQTLGGVHSHLVRRIEVLRAELAISVEVPQVQYVGGEFGYRIHISNKGNAPASDVRITAELPPELELVEAEEEGQTDGQSGRVVWRLKRLAPGEKRTLAATCRCTKPGLAVLTIQAEAPPEVSAHQQASVRIEGFADLEVVIHDPPTPTPVGQEAEYEVVVENRGTRAAENVELVVFFSEGIEPVKADGAEHIIAPGQVVFQPLASIDPGQKHTFRVVAEASVAGNHVCRAEITCRPLRIRMVRDQVTRFYTTGVAAIAERSDDSTQR